MAFSLKKKKNGEDDKAVLLEQLREKEEAVSFYMSAARSLLVMLKQFPLDLEEINTRGFIQLVDEIGGKISESRKAV